MAPEHNAEGEHKRAQQLTAQLSKALTSAQEYQRVLQVSCGGTWAWDVVKGTVRLPDHWLSSLGLPTTMPEAVDETFWHNRIHPDDKPLFDEAVAALFNGSAGALNLQYRVRHHDGDYRLQRCCGVPLHDEQGQITRISGTHTDLTLTHWHDFDTALFNERYLTQHLSDRLPHWHAQRGQIGLLMVSFRTLDILLEYQELEVSNRIRRDIATRLRQAFGNDCAIALLPGDTFALIVSPIDEMRIASRLDEMFREPLVVATERHFLIPIAAFAVYGDTDKDTAAALISSARLALRTARKQQTPFPVRYQRAFFDAAEREAKIENALLQAIDQRRVKPHFQPIIDISTRRVKGVEALIRINHPLLDNPAEFIPVAEMSGLMRELGYQVIHHSLRLLQELLAWPNLPPDFYVSINFSPTQLTGVSEAHVFLNMLKDYGIPPQRIQAEITESAMFIDEATAFRMMALTRSHGVRMALDDFGTGYSSLSYLQRMPIDTLKLDKSFIDGLKGDRVRMTLLATIIKMCRTLGYSSVAEGIETEDVHDLLVAMGIQNAQGYLYAKPMARKVFVSWYREQLQQLAKGAPQNRVQSQPPNN
ncbi:MAG: EAL domain-containing protein [Natronospirillum sp.]